MNTIDNFWRVQQFVENNFLEISLNLKKNKTTTGSCNTVRNHKRFRFFVKILKLNFSFSNRMFTWRQHPFSASPVIQLNVIFSDSVECGIFWFSWMWYLLIQLNVVSSDSVECGIYWLIQLNRIEAIFTVFSPS